MLELSGKVNVDVGEFLTAVNLDTLVCILDSYSEVEETGDADLAFRVNVATGLGIAAMAHAYDKEKLLEILPKFKPLLKKLPDSEVSCLLGKISL